MLERQQDLVYRGRKYSSFSTWPRLTHECNVDRVRMRLLTLRAVEEAGLTAVNIYALTSGRLTMNANNLVCWLLLRILSTPGLADEIRRETKRFFRDGNAPIDTTQPLLEGSGKGDLGRWCPLLKACYLETVRLDSEIVSVRKIRRDNLVPETETAPTSAFKLKAGDYLHAFHYLHHTDPEHFEEPERFKPERFLIREAGSMVVSQRTLRPYGAGVSMCKGRVVAERVCMHMVAGLLHHWEFEPAGFGWKIPGHISAAGICKPSEDVRVHVSRKIYVQRRPNVERRATAG